MFSGDRGLRGAGLLRAWRVPRAIALGARVLQTYFFSGTKKLTVSAVIT
jgi:hypothetical protein